MKRYKPTFKRMTDRYDKETDHSLNHDAQKKWDEKIRQAMKTGRPFR
jgi:hypothetical protein